MIDLDTLSFNDSPGTLEDRCVSEYILEEGIRVIPVMGPMGTPPSIVRVHAAYTKRRSDFRYIRNKVPPLIPAPGDTQPVPTSSSTERAGDIYLGGSIAVFAPGQDGDGNLVYKVSGGYNFVTTEDLRQTGEIRFDAHGYRSLVDFLGVVRLGDKKEDTTWNSPLFDLNVLASARILG